MQQLAAAPENEFEEALAGHGTAPAFSGSESGPTPLGSPMLQPRYGGTHSEEVRVASAFQHGSPDRARTC